MREVIVNGESRFDALSVIESARTLTLNLVTAISMENLQMIFMNAEEITVDGQKYEAYRKLHYIQKIWESETPAVVVEMQNVYNDTDALEVLIGDVDITYDEAVAKRAEMEALASYVPDDKIPSYIWIFAEWDGDQVEYKVDDRVKWNDIVYKCLIAHTSQPEWNPQDATSLWVKVLNPDPETIPVWEQPSAGNPYMTGDKVYYPDENGSIYMSTIDNNIWSPMDYPQGWQLIE